MALRDRTVPEAYQGEITELVTRFRARLLEEVNIDEVADLDMPLKRARLERVLSRILSIEGPVMSTRKRARVIQRVIDDTVGLGVLEPLISDESVTEIMVNGIHDLFVERSGRIERIPAAFTSEEELMQVIDRIVSSINRRVDESRPMVDARLAGGERVNIIIPPLALDGPTVTIRRFPRPFRMSDLVAKASLSPDAGRLLDAMVRARLSILVSGGTGTGKTTFLNALSGLIPEHERIITIEDSAELSLQQEHVVRLESRPANSEGRGEVTIRDLVRNSLRMRPDRIVVGEVRGGETMDMLQAMSTGHEGSLTTVHANSARDALGRVETLASMSDLDLPVDTIRDQVNSAIDIIVQLERDAAGVRRVRQIEAVVSEHREPFRTVPVLTYERSGSFTPHRLPDALLQRLTEQDAVVPEAFGGAGGPQ
ncbi:MULTISPECIES: CpaF family protein [unclassified Actinomyces]|uniref:CpaF family protein n=1 Tax=unclassified Actinomyces TaxID=2609248 RepID=UPI0020172D39|nr:MULTISPECIES: CpaF family protein [unclassified Actinomyces]MCL3777076.1 CpaF family protein [Actinomyces sp. AC-20-1]MCL3790296.1 CpaF family protein [Actinomyces sp. 187325]MCL3793078.1 CpaF family protein [Actinomyces sp. 186855]MCL3793800.1 CpaF family protein [Actinomyces sp. 217892]